MNLILFIIYISYNYENFSLLGRVNIPDEREREEEAKRTQFMETKRNKIEGFALVCCKQTL